MGAKQQVFSLLRVTREARRCPANPCQPSALEESACAWFLASERVKQVGDM